MHQMSSFVDSIYYGFNDKNLYLKIIPQNTNFIDDKDVYHIEIVLIEPMTLTIQCNLKELFRLDFTDQLDLKEKAAK